MPSTTVCFAGLIFLCMDGTVEEGVGASNSSHKEQEDELIDYNNDTDVTSHKEDDIGSLDRNDQDVDMQGSNALAIAVPADGTPSSPTSIGDEDGTMGTSPNTSTALPAADGSEETTSQGP